MLTWKAKKKKKRSSEAKCCPNLISTRKFTKQKEKNPGSIFCRLVSKLLVNKLYNFTFHFGSRGGGYSHIPLNYVALKPISKIPKPNFTHQIKTRKNRKIKQKTNESMPTKPRQKSWHQGRGVKLTKNAIRISNTRFRNH